MPKDEFDPEDPLELRGVSIPTEENTLPLMAEVFVEEFMRLGYGASQILALFRAPWPWRALRARADYPSLCPMGPKSELGRGGSPPRAGDVDVCGRVRATPFRPGSWGIVTLDR
jgi:hypothetical protein